MLMKHLSAILIPAAAIIAGCENVDHNGEIHAPENVYIPLENVARLISSLPLEKEQMGEVHDAVSSSSGNGYDEEYTMQDLFISPGAGVGMDTETRAVRTRSYSRPLKDLIAEHLALGTRAEDITGSLTPKEYMEALEKSDIQIYWPYSENWNSRDWPIITFDPGNGAEVNIGYRMVESPDGSRSIEEIVVDEQLALTEPVWVINRNSDSGFSSIEMRRRDDPEWGTGGGSITIRPQDSGPDAGTESGYSRTKGQPVGKVRTLVLKDFKMRRNYDCWFAGASEFFVKCGSVEDFTASTEAELKLYSPKITDFMLVVKRNQVGQTIPMNVVLVSQWTEQLEDMAFMLTEDDGGSRTEWKCSATVKVKSKSYGFDIALPFNTRDDIVWRGSLSAPYLERYDGIASRFGDVELTFTFLER